MNVLFVAPSEVSSGESVTALHMAEWLQAEGCSIHFLVSRFTRTFVSSRFGGAVTTLESDSRANRETWNSVLRRLRPAAIVFADYPLLTLSSGVTPLWDKDWEAELNGVDAELFTLDHLGYAQRPRLLFFGPPHGTLGVERIPQSPPRMQVLLPCPLHDPRRQALRGRHFRYWNTDSLRHRPSPRAAREKYARWGDELLVLHLTSGWACRAAELLGHPYYSLLPRFLVSCLTTLNRPVTVLSVNNGRLLPETEQEMVRIRNTGPMDPDSYEHLLLASDLIVTENRISVTLAKAISLLQPCVTIHNSWPLAEVAERAAPAARSLAEEMERLHLASVFPFEVFPIWARSDLEALDIFDETCLGGAFASVELFGGPVTAAKMQALLADDDTRNTMRRAQLSYLESLECLPPPLEAVSGAAAACGGSRSA